MSTALAARTVLVSILGIALASAPAASNDGRDHKRHEVLTIDHAVPHVSTVPANAGEEVVLFVRERISAKRAEERHKRRGGNKIVLFVHGGSVPAVPDYDLPYENYSWAEFLAREGYDVFIMDQTGYGFSPRPEMDDPCNANPDQQELLVPNPLEAPCDLSYPYNLTNRLSDRDEMNSVVDYILDLRGGHRVNLIGWSGGVFRIGVYAATYPEKVETLYFYAGLASPTAPSEPPFGLPEPGFPLNLQTYEGLMGGRWDAEVGCEDQFDPDIRPVVWNTMMSFDPLGSTWGSPPWNPVASPEGGILRYPTAAFDWGWNAEMAADVKAPSVVIVGEFDAVREPSRGLYEALGTKHKVFIEVACASHFLVWENQHEILFDTSKEWLRKRTVDGERTGTFWVDETGQINRQ